MRGRRSLPTGLCDVARTGVPIGLLILAAAVPPARPIVLAILIAGFAVAVRRTGPTRWAWAARSGLPGVIDLAMQGTIDDRRAMV